MLENSDRKVLAALTAEDWKTPAQLIQEEVGTSFTVHAALSLLSEERLVESLRETADPERVRDFERDHGAPPLLLRAYRLTAKGLDERGKL